MQERGRGLYMMSTFCDELNFLREDGQFGVRLLKIPQSVRGASTGTDESS
jgi:hypothetical protein